MWESGPWLPRWLFPEYLPFYWAALLVLAGLCAWLGRRELANLLNRVGRCLALAQASVIAAAAVWAHWRPLPELSVNDVYVVAAATTCIMFAVAGLWLGVALLRSPSMLRPSVAEASGKWSPLLLVVGVCVSTFGCGLLVLVFAGFLLDPERSTITMAGSFGLMAFAAACDILAPRHEGASTPTPDPDAPSSQNAARDATQRHLPALLGVLGLLGHVGLVLVYPPPRGMTDAALFAMFEREVTDASVSRDAMEELRRRPSGRFSTLSASLHPTRWLPGELTSRVHAQRGRATGYPGCSMPISLESMPYEGEPELDLLGVLVTRGELEAPRAWERDARVDADFRRGLQTLISKRVAAN